MDINYIAILFLVAAFGGAYLMRYYKWKYDLVWLILATLCLSAYMTFMLIGGASLFDTALGVAVLAVAVFMLEEREGETLAV